MKVFKSSFQSILFLLFLSFCFGANAQISVPSAIKTQFENGTIPTATMGYINKDGEMEFFSLGNAVWGQDEPVTENHIFRIYSMTKALTSVAALQLVEQGKVSLDEPLDQWLPEINKIPILSESGELIIGNNPITLRNLLTHTSGFGYRFMEPKLQGFSAEDWEYPDDPRLNEVGERFRYGTSSQWAGRLVEKLSGVDLETYFRENITQPLQMHSTWYNVPDSLQHLIVSFGERNEDTWREYPRIPSSKYNTFSGGEGLFSSAKDYLKFLHCILNDGKYSGGQILKAETVDEMFENKLSEGIYIPFNMGPDGGNRNGEFHSLSWALNSSPSTVMKSDKYGYWAGAANTFFTIDKTNNIAVVFFNNYFPMMDPESIGLYRLFVREIYKNQN